MPTVIGWKECIEDGCEYLTGNPTEPRCHLHRREEVKA